MLNSAKLVWVEIPIRSLSVKHLAGTTKVSILELEFVQPRSLKTLYKNPLQWHKVFGSSSAHCQGLYKETLRGTGCKAGIHCGRVTSPSEGTTHPPQTSQVI